MPRRSRSPAQGGPPRGRLSLVRELPVAAVSPDEAERMYGISKRLLYTYMRDGRLKSIKVSTRRIIRIADIEAFLDTLESTKPE